MKWTNEYKVTYYDTDYNNILKPASIARYMQNTAWNALKSWGPTPQYLKENNLAFILSKISFRYYRQMREDDEIKTETWAITPSERSIIFTRNYRMYKGETITAEASSAWALMDMKEKVILKPDVLGENFKGFDDEALNFGVHRGRFNIPANPPQLRDYRNYKVRCADIDTNFHMNNVAYIDLITECLYNDGDMISPDLNKRIVSLDLSYNSEAVFGDIIEIEIDKFTNIENGCEEIYLSGTVGDVGGERKGCFEAKVVVNL